MSFRARGILAVVLGGWVFLTLSLATVHTLDGPPVKSSVCRFLPNAWVPTAPAIYGGCPLKPYDRVAMVRVDGLERHVTDASDIDKAIQASADAVAVQVERDGEKLWMSVPLVLESSGHRIGRVVIGWLVVLLLEGLAVSILVTSRAPAVPPFALFFTCLSLVLTWFLFGYRDTTLSLLARPAWSLMPAAAFHLALTFPRRREVVRRVSGVVVVPYIVSLSLLYIGHVTVLQSPAVWAIVDRLVFVLIIIAAAIHTVGCALAMRESGSRLERARARVLLLGAFCALLVPVALNWSLGDAIPGASMVLPIVGVSMIPAFLGYAIARYHLFDLTLNIRKVVATAVYLVTVAALVAGLTAVFVPSAGSTLETLPAVFGAVACSLLLAEVPRHLLRRAFSDFVLPWEERLGRLEHEYAQKTIELSDVDSCIRELGETIREGLAPSWISIFLVHEGELRLAYLAGQGAVTELEGAKEDGLFLIEELTHLVSDEDLENEWSQMLLEAGTEVIVPIKRAEERFGVALVAARESETPYSQVHRTFLSRVATQCAIAVYSAELTRNLLSTERYAAMGRTGANLAHEMKPLGAVLIGARQIQTYASNSELVLEKAAMIEKLAGEMLQFVRGLLSDNNRFDAPEGVENSMDIREAINGAVEFVESSYGTNRICVRLPSSVPEVSGDAVLLTRALSNLLENALLAGEPDDVIEVVVTVVDDDLVMTVADSGCGMTPDTLRQVFDPFFTTRGSTRGTGLGLPIARDLVVRLGGRIDVTSAEGAGTEVTIVLPVIGSRPDGKKSL